MPLVTSFMVYVVVWWVVWFAVLPLRVQIPDQVPSGQATSAPENPRLLWKAGLTTLIAALLWVLIWWLVAYDPLGFNLLDSR